MRKLTMSFRPYVPDHGIRSGTLGREWEDAMARLARWEAEQRQAEEAPPKRSTEQ